MAQTASQTVFLAGDEAGLYLQATTCYVWSPTGQTPIIWADPGRAKTNFYGSLNLQTGQEIAMRSDLMNAEVSAQHLEMILDANPDVPVILLWDRAPWHCGKPIDQVLEENPRLKIIFFPTASPDLKPQEHVWKTVRKEVSHNRLEAKLPKLADLFLNKLNSCPFKSFFPENMVTLRFVRGLADTSIRSKLTSADTTTPLPNARTGFPHFLPDPQSCATILESDDKHAQIN